MVFSFHDFIALIYAVDPHTKTWYKGLKHHMPKKCVLTETSYAGKSLELEVVPRTPCVVVLSWMTGLLRLKDGSHITMESFQVSTFQVQAHLRVCLPITVGIPEKRDPAWPHVPHTMCCLHRGDTCRSQATGPSTAPELLAHED